jgi:hypothetical protein
MTREESTIQALRNHIEALEETIKALKKEYCKDAVSRQAVLNTLFYKSDNNCEVVLNKELNDRIKSLPSVTPTQEPILDKIKAEIEDTLYVDSLIFGELFDFKDGKISADDVIEEFNRVTRLEVLKIIDKYKAER